MNFQSGVERTSAKSSSVIWGAWMAAIPAGIILYGMVADSPFVAAMETNRYFLACWNAIQIGALLTGVAIALGGTVVAWSVVREAVVNRRRDLVLPVAAFSILVAWMAGVVVWTGGHWAPLPWTVQFANPGWPSETFRWIAGSITTVLLIVAFTTSAVSAAQILRRSSWQDVGISLPGANVTVAPGRFARFLAPFAAVGFAVMFAGALGWGFEASRIAAFHSQLGPFGLSSAVTWLISLALFGGSATFAIRAT